MNIQECYEAFGGDYQEALTRLVNMESMVIKYAKKFLNDTTFAALVEAMAANNIDEIFRASHTLKGVCLNLSFTELGSAAVTLTDMVRKDASGNLPDGTTDETVAAAFADVKAQYERVIGALRQLD